jgi:hypothetical protein
VLTDKNKISILTGGDFFMLFYRKFTGSAGKLAGNFTKYSYNTKQDVDEGGNGK